MKNDLSCGVVRDLLPSYMEDLLGEESKEAVDRHLEGCPECRARKEAMTSPAETEETAKEVDYLKRVKKGTAKKVVLAVVCTVLLVVGGYLLKEFVIGRTPDAEHISIEFAQVDGGNNLTLLADTYWGAYELRGLKASTRDGVLTYTAREVRVNIFQALFMREKIGGMEGYWKQIPLSIPLDGLTEVWVCGRLVWQDGMVISKECLDLLDAKTPYCGDAPALGRIAELLNISQVLGLYTTSLRTSSQPYVWTLEFRETFNTEDWKALHYFAYQMLALVENLDKVGYTYEPEHANGRTQEERIREGSVSAESASKLLARLTEKYNEAHHTDWPVHESVKEYAESPLEYQRMVTLLKEHIIYR